MSVSSVRPCGGGKTGMQKQRSENKSMSSKTLKVLAVIFLPVIAFVGLTVYRTGFMGAGYAVMHPKEIALLYNSPSRVVEKSLAYGKTASQIKDEKQKEALSKVENAIARVSEDATSAIVDENEPDGKGDSSAVSMSDGARQNRPATVEIRNGSGIAGGASSLAKVVSENGFAVAKVGNADSFTYVGTTVYDVKGVGAEAIKNLVHAAKVVNGKPVGFGGDVDFVVVIGRSK